MKANSNQSGRSAQSWARRRMLSHAGRAEGLMHSEGGGVEQLENRVHLAVITWDGGPDGIGTNFNDPVNWVGDVLPGPGDDAVIPDMPGAPTIGVTDDIEINSLTSGESISLLNGLLSLHAPSVVLGDFELGTSTSAVDGAGDLTIGGEFRWYEGTLDGAGAIIIDVGGSMSFLGTLPYLLGRSIVNNGNAEQGSAEIDLASGISIINNGSWSIAGEGRIQAATAVGPIFVNYGALNKSASPLFAALIGGPSAAATVINTGEVTVLSGTLVLEGGMNSGTMTLLGIPTELQLSSAWTHEGGSEIAGDGILRFNDTSTQTIAGATLWSVDTVAVEIGVLTGAGALSISGTLAWTGGTIEGDGLLEVLSGGTFLIAGVPQTPLVLSRTVTNNGTIELESGEVHLDGVSIQNGAFGLIQTATNGELVLIHAVSGASTITSQGMLSIGVLDELRLWSIGEATLSYINAAPAYIDVEGTLRFWSVDVSNSASIQVEVEGLIEFTGSLVHDVGATLSGAGEVELINSAVTINDAADWTGLQVGMSGGSIDGPGNLSVSWFAATGGSTISGDGTLDVGSTASFSGVTLNRNTTSTGTLTVNGAMDGAGDLTITGHVNWNDGALSGTGTLIIDGGATMTIGGLGRFLNRNLVNWGEVAQGSTVLGLGSVSITNHGDWTTSQLITSSYATAPIFINHGTLIKTGTNSSILGGLAPGATVLNHGLIVVTEGTLIIGGITGGANFGVIQIDPNAKLRIEAAWSHEAGSRIYGGTLEIIFSVQTINGFTSWDAATISLLSTTSGITGSADLSIGGEFTWSGASPITGTGSITIASGGELVVTASSASLSRPLTNLGTVSISGGTLTIGAGTAAVSSGTWNLQSGSITGAGSLTITGGSFNWSGGTLSGTGALTINAGGALLLSAPAATISRPLINNGTVTQNGTILTIVPGRSVSTSGTWNFNSGQITGDGEFAINGGSFNQTGGTFAGTGRLTIGPSANASLAGTLTRGLHNYGWVTVNGFGALLKLTSSDNLNAGTIYLLNEGELDLSDGPMTHLGGSSILCFDNNGSSINIKLGSAVQTIAAGLVTWDVGQGSFYFDSGGNITGPGDLRLVGTTYIDGPITINGTGRLEIDGALLIFESMTLSRSLFLETSTNPDARLEVQPGVTLTLTAAPANLVGGTLQGGWWNVAGTLLLPEGVQINSLNAWVSLNAGGSFPAIMSISSTGPDAILTPHGAHTFAPAGGTLTNGGRISLTLGSLMTVNGAFTNGAGGTIAASVSGTNPETDMGRLAATGAVTLGGSFQADGLLGLMPGAGETFTFISGASRSGSFSSISLPAASGGLTTVPVYTANSFGMAALSVRAWDGGPTGLGTNFHDPVNWVGDVLPGAGEIAYISVGANPTITVTANITIGGLISDETITQSGGTFTINGAAEFNALFTLSGGTLTGSGNFNFNSSFTWSGGTLAGTGVAQFGPGPAITFSGGTLTANRNLVFDRAVTLSGGMLTGSGNFLFDGGLMWNGSTLAGTGVATIPDGQTLTMNTTSSRTLGRTLEVFGTADWTAGQISGGSFTVRPDGELIVNLESSYNFVNSNILNEGLIRIIGTGSVSFGAGSNVSFTNAAMGTIEVLSASVGFFTNSATLSFSNLGSIDIAAGRSVSLYHNNPNSPGTLNASFGGGSVVTGAGNFHVSQGTLTFSTGAQFSLTGTLNISAGTVNFNTGQAVEFASLVSLTAGTLAGSDNLTFNGGLTWNGSTLAGTGVATIPDGQTLTMSTTSNRNLNRTLEVFGNANWTAGDIALTGTLAIRAGGELLVNVPSGQQIFSNYATGTVLNQGLIRIVGAYLSFSGFNSTLNVTNAATGTIHAETGSVYFSTNSGGLNFTSAGTLQIDAGRSADFGGGVPVATFNSGAVVTGAGNFNIGAQASITFNTGSTTTLPVHVSLTGGTLGGSDNLVFNGGLNFTGGILAGTGVVTIPAGQVLDMTSGGTRQINRSVDNFGTTNWTIGDIDMFAAATFTNRPGGQFNVSGSNSLVWAGRMSSGGSLTRFVNEGTFTKTGTGDVSWLGQASDARFENHGVIDLLAGSMGQGWNTGTHTGVWNIHVLLGFGGGSPTAHTFAAGSIVQGAGSVSFGSTGSTMFNAGSQFDVSGAVSISGGTVNINFGADVQVQTLTLSGGTLQGAGDIRISGVFTWAGGTLTGTGQTVLLDTGSLTISTARTTDRPLTVEGSLTIGTGGTLNYRAATLANSGTITLSGGGVIRRDLAGTSTLLNTGTLQTGAGGGSLAASTGTFTLDNQGTVLVNGGQTLTVSAFANLAAGTLAAGTWDVGGTLTLPSGAAITTIGAAAHVRLVSTGAINRSGSGSALATLAANDGELTLHDGAPWGFKPAGDIFTNNGTFNVTGVGTVSVPVHVTFNNGADGELGGTLNIGDAMRGPGPEIEFGPFDGGGVININGVVAFNQDSEVFAIVNLFTPGTLTGSGDILVSGTFNWYGGLQSGTGSTSVSTPNTLNMFGDGVMTLSREMTNLVAGNWTGGDLALDSGQFINGPEASLTISGQVEILSAESGGEQFINEGELVLAPGSDSSFGTNVGFANSGSVLIESLVEFLEDETLFGSVELALGGEITGPGTVTFADLFVWSGGAMTGTGQTIVADTATLILGDGELSLSRTFRTFSTAGSWSGGCLLMSNGTFINEAGASLDIFANPTIDVINNGGTSLFVNNGLMTVHTGEFVLGVPGINSGTIIVISPDTLIFETGWTYSAGSSLEGPGSVAFMGGMHSFPTGGFSITGPVAVMAGTVVLAADTLLNYNAATFTFTGGDWTVGDGAELYLNGADVRAIGPGTSFTIAGDGSLSGLSNLSSLYGTMNLESGAQLSVNPNATSGTFDNSGRLRIGPGAVLSIAGSYTQSAFAFLDIGIAGTTDSFMGRMLITGAAALGGSLDLHFENGFIPGRGDSFRFLSSAGTVGDFDAAIIPVLADTSLKSPVLTDTLGVRLIVTHIADHNNDLAVNVPDIFSFLSSWFAGDGDFNDDGSTSVPDIFSFLSAWFSAA